MKLPPSATIVEVGPRDGFQMEQSFIPTDLKVEIINAIARTGIRKIEATSFVNPKRIAQMADASEVMKRIERRPGVLYSALVPNVKGAERAADAGVDAIRVVLCCTESYNRRNIGRSVDESLAEFQAVLRFAGKTGLRAEAILSLSFGCPLEGAVDPERVFDLTARLVDLGFTEISIADSIGVADPIQVSGMMNRMRTAFPSVSFSMHLHDTRGLGLANVLAALEEGITVFDASIGGLGGCPVMQGGAGNIPTEDLAAMLNGMGVLTGVSPDAVVLCSERIQDFLGRTLPSRILRAGTRERLFADTPSR